LPLRLHVDQDALDFLKKFFNFVNPNSPIESEPKTEAYLRKLSLSFYPTAALTLWARVDHRTSGGLSSLSEIGLQTKTGRLSSLTGGKDN
jgi:hypothetical protein